MIVCATGSPATGARVDPGEARPAITAATSAREEGGRPILRNFTARDYQADPLCQAVIEDRDGIILVANNVNALSYDGATWRLIELPVESGGIRQFALGADGVVYAGGSGVLGRIDGGPPAHTFTSLRGALPDAAGDAAEIDILQVIAIGDTVYFVASDRIYARRRGRFTVTPCPSTPRSRGPRLHPVGDVIYVTQPGRGLGRLEPAGVALVSDDARLADEPIVLVEAATTGGLNLLTANHGFLHWDGTALRPVPTPSDRFLRDQQVRKALRLPDGGLVVAYSAPAGNGGARFDRTGAFVGPLDASIGLLNPALRDFCVDREGGLWIGLESGISRLEIQGAVTVFDAINGLGSGFVCDVARADGRLYAATIEGVYQLQPAEGRTPARFTQVFGTPVYSVAAHPHGLFGLGYENLYRQTGAGFEPVIDLPPNMGVVAVSRRNPDRIWFNTADRAVRSLHWDGSRWLDEGPLPGVTGTGDSLAEAPDGTLWVETPHDGFIRLTFQPGGADPRGTVTLQRFPPGAAGLPGAVNRCHLTSAGGEPLFFTNRSNRPLRFDAGAGRFTPLPEAALPYTPVQECWATSYCTDPGTDVLWQASSSPRPDERGLFMRHTGAAAFRRAPHLIADTAGKVWRLRLETTAAGDPVVWVAAANGLLRLEPDRLFAPPAAFAVQLSRPARWDGADQDLSWDHARLDFDYVAPRFRSGADVTYRTRLVGLETDWRPWSPDRHRGFVRLPAGDFRFEVQARDADGVSTPVVAQAFTVRPPWWRSWWGALAWIGLATGGLVGLVRVRTRSLHRRARRLEVLVADRTASLVSQNRELVRLHRLELDEKITARLAAEKARLETLRYQLNPHFLFNSLTSVRSQIPLSLPRARESIDLLADFCRQTLQDKAADALVAWADEEIMLRSYLEIEQARLGELLVVQWDVGPDLPADLRLPPLLLLPLVENALKYGAATSADRLELRVAVHVAAGRLVIEIANTGRWIEPDEAHPGPSLGIGHDNLRERLHRYYPNAHAFGHRSKDGWVVVWLKLHLANAVAAQPGVPS